MSITSVGRSESQQRDLARGEHPKRRTPESGATAGVQLGPITLPTQTMYDRLFQSDKKVERPDLTTVGVTRDLKIDMLLDLIKC